MSGVTVKCRTKLNGGKVRRAVKRSNPTSLKGAGALLRRVAARSVKKSKKSSAVGAPPHTRQGRLKRSILFAVNQSLGSVIIGPAATIISRTQHYHEFGLPQKRKRKNYGIGMSGPIRIGKDGRPVFALLVMDRQVKKAKALDRKYWPETTTEYPKRPLMGPALEKIRGQLPQQWRGVVKE